MVERVFQLKQNNTNVRTEVIAGVATFMTMAYIIFVNPAILSAAGVPFGPAVVATALAGGLATLAMGLFTNYPLALASGMGLNAVLAFGLVGAQGLSWQTAMGVVVVEGALVSLLVLTNVREAVMNAIPLSLKRAIGVGIGLFISFIGLKNAGIVIKPAAPDLLVAAGDFTSPGVILSVFGVFVTAFLMARRVKGSILIGILITAAVAVVMELSGIKILVPGSLEKAKSIISFPTAGSLATVAQADILGVFRFGLYAAVFAFLVTDFFDTMGTVVAVGGQAGLLDKQGRLPRLKNVLLVDSLAAVLGGFLGVSSVTTYIESAAGVGEGGRTGLTSVVVAILFFLSILFTPIIGVVPAQATAPALIIVGFLMMTVIRDIPFDRFDEGLPAFLTLLGMPLTFSISEGIGFGFISYTLIKLFTGQTRDVHPLMYVASLLFVVDFIL